MWTRSDAAAPLHLQTLVNICWFHAACLGWLMMSAVVMLLAWRILDDDGGNFDAIDNNFIALVGVVGVAL